MRKFAVAGLGAVAVLSAGAPALAQGWDGYGAWSPGWGHGLALPPDRGVPPAPYWQLGFHQDEHGLRDRIDRLGAKVGEGQAHGWLAPWDAQHDYSELRAVSDQLHRFKSQEGGLYQGQQYALSARLDHVDDELRQQHRWGR